MNKKLFFTLALVGAFISAQPTIGEPIDVFNNGAALLNGIEGGSISAPGSTVTMSVNAGVKGAVADWKTLNVPQANTLNFYFPNAGQYALNKVSTGVSNIAGNVGYASGSQAGTVIISNPNGVLCSGTSVINMAGSLLLTTHDVAAVDEGIMKLTSQADALGKYHGVTIMPGAQLSLGGNLTIASLGIDMNGANIASKDSILVTSDGLNYVLAEKPTAEKITNVTSADTQPSMVFYNKNATNPNAYGGSTPKTKVANSAIKTTDGKIIIKSNAGDVDVASSKFDGDTSLVAKDNVNVTSSATIAYGEVEDQTKGAFLGNLEVTAGKNATLSSVSQDTTVPVYKDLTINAGDKITLRNVRMMNGADYTATLNADTVDVSNYDTSSKDWSKTILGNVNSNAKNFTVTQTQIQGNSNITATENINSYGSLLGTAGKTTTLNAKNIVVDKGPIDGVSGYIARTRGTLNATASESITLANNYLLPSESADLILDAPSITMTNFSGKSASLNNFTDLNVAGAKIFGDLSLTGMKDASGDLLTSAIIDNLTVNGDLTTDDMASFALTNSTVNGDYTADNITALTMTNDVIKGNVTLTNIGNATVDGLTTENGSLTTNDIDTMKLTNSTIDGDYNANRVNDLQMKDDVIKGDVNIDTAAKVAIDNLTTEGGSLTTNNVTDKVSFVNSNIDGDYNAKNVKELEMDNDIISGNVNIDGATKATVDNSNIGGDFTAKNITDTLSMDNDIIGGNVILDQIAKAVVTDSTVNGDFTASNIDDLTLDNDTFKGNVTIDPAGTVAITNSDITKDLTVRNADELTMDNDTVGGNIILDNIDKVVMNKVTGDDTLYISNVDDWTMDDTHIKNGIVTDNIGNFTTNDNNNTYNNGQPYTYVAPVPATAVNLEDSANVLSAYVDTLNVGDAPSFNAGGGEFTARAFAAGDDEDEDYKEEFLRKSVKEDKDGNLYTIDTFRGE